ncbi:transporter substrate-binding domain-containing protein [Streptomyces sp. NPDC059875]|uniref:transporter substrate-binding domain-containing protein n=1 Tax=unclassified Streptomyces TaxID=2593676 RepID=UPI003668ABD0
MHRTRRTLTVLALLATVLSALVACGKEGSPPVKGPQPDQLPVYQVQSALQLPDSSTWRKAKERGHLVVGAKEDQPYMGEKDPATGRYSGIDIEIARMMSASLGFDPASIEFRTIASANRETALQNGQIDYYVGTYTINDNRKKLVGFAGPYYMAGQSLLVRTDDRHGDRADLHRDVHAALLVRHLGGSGGASQSQDQGRGRPPGRTRDAAAGWGPSHGAVAASQQPARSRTRPAAAGDHFSRSGTDTYEGSAGGEEKVSCAPVGLCSM